MHSVAARDPSGYLLKACRLEFLLSRTFVVLFQETQSAAEGVRSPGDCCDGPQYIGKRWRSRETRDCKRLELASGGRGCCKGSGLFEKLSAFQPIGWMGTSEEVGSAGRCPLFR